MKLSMKLSIEATKVLILAMILTTPVKSEGEEVTLDLILLKIHEVYIRVHAIDMELAVIKDSTFKTSTFKTEQDTERQVSDQQARQAWPILITKTVNRFASRPEKFKKILKSVISARISSSSGLGEGPQGGSLREMLISLVKVNLGVTSEQLQKVPTPASYEAFRDLVDNLNSVANQKILESELDKIAEAISNSSMAIQEIMESELVKIEKAISKCEKAIKDSEGKITIIQSLTYVTVIAVLANLVLLILGAYNESENRQKRETERRIGAAVVHELQPFVQPPSGLPNQGRTEPATSRQ